MAAQPRPQRNILSKEISSNKEQAKRSQKPLAARVKVLVVGVAEAGLNI
jgi:hypothetical protein